MQDRIHDAFDRVRASEELKASTAAYLRAAREKSTPRRSARRQGLLAACAALLLAVGLGSYRTLQTPVSYLSIDVNPSVELALNRLDRIVAATPYNEDGERVLEGLKLTGRRYTDGIELLLESGAMQPYLDESAELTVTVAAGSEEKEAALLSGVESCAGYGRHRGQSVRAGIDSLTEAHGSGLSFGKYAAYQTLAEYDETVTTADCRGMSMAELHERIRACQHGAEAPGGNGYGGGNGAGNGSGNGHHGYGGGHHGHAE